MGQKERERRSVHQEVERFNREFPIGTLVTLRKDSGPIVTRVRGSAAVMYDIAVAWFDGVSGCYAIKDRVTKMDAVEASA